MIHITDRGLPLASGDFKVTKGSLQQAMVEAKKFTEIHASITHPMIAYSVKNFMVCRVVNTPRIGWLSDGDVVYVFAKEWGPGEVLEDVIYRCEFQSEESGWGSWAGATQ